MILRILFLQVLRRRWHAFDVVKLIDSIHCTILSIQKTTLKINEWCATGNLTINYLEASYPGTKLISKGKIVRRGKSLAHLFGEIIDENGKIHANATGIWNIWGSKPQKFKNKDK